MKITCHNKDCKFQFEYNGNEIKPGARSAPGNMMISIQNSKEVQIKYCVLPPFTLLNFISKTLNLFFFVIFVIIFDER